MATIEAGVRGGAIVVLLLLALLTWRDAWRLPVGRYSTLYILTGVCYLVESAPGLITTEPTWLVPLRFGSAISPALFQLWARATFDDSFKPSWFAWLPTAAMAGLIAWAMTEHQWLPWRIVEGAALLIVCVGVWQIISGRRGDLVEGRRRLRLLLAIAVALLIIGLTIHAAVTSPALRAHSSLVTASFVLAMGLLWTVLRLGLRTRPDLALVPAGDTAPQPATQGAVAIDPEERALLDRLRRLMEEDRIYREEGFGIAVLAERMNLPEYRLRRLINRRLGHRNFTSFISGYRLAETMAALADPTQAQVPILTIALDAGFQSLGPFNRAFKAQTGVTPSEFRRDRLGETLEPPGQVAAPPADAPISKSASF
jgi:AraC-like DNA-binding protein